MVGWFLPHNRGGVKKGRGLVPSPSPGMNDEPSIILVVRDDLKNFAHV